MIEAHNGKMEYTGELNKGAEFTIYIPRGEGGFMNTKSLNKGDLK